MPSILKTIPAILFLFTSSVSFAEMGIQELNEKIEADRLSQITKEARATEEIYIKEELLFCGGELPAAKYNNAGAELILKGRYDEAVDHFRKAIRRAPAFMPFYFNAGVAAYFEKDYRMSDFYLTKARDLFPEFYLTYIHLGHLLLLKGKDTESIINYRKALRLNPKFLNAFIYLGDIYFKRDQLEAAMNYYNAALSLDPAFPNGIIGKGKIEFRRDEIYKAYMTFKTIDTSKDYDKSLHYYFAECAYKLQDYKEAYNQYRKLLEYRSDRFFITTSVRLVEHKMNLSEQFASQMEVGN